MRAQFFPASRTTAPPATAIQAAAFAAARDPQAPPPPRRHTSAPTADLQPCRLCNGTHRRRMYALMTHWYGQYVGLPEDHGYFYLCPRCHALFIRPHEAKKNHG
jgi:hypothetical protein